MDPYRRHLPTNLTQRAKTSHDTYHTRLVPEHIDLTKRLTHTCTHVTNVSTHGRTYRQRPKRLCLWNLRRTTSYTHESAIGSCMHIHSPYLALKPPQTTGRRADLAMALHRRLCRTEIPATGNTMLFQILSLLPVHITVRNLSLLMHHGSQPTQHACSSTVLPLMSCMLITFSFCELLPCTSRMEPALSV